MLVISAKKKKKNKPATAFIVLKTTDICSVLQLVKSQKMPMKLVIGVETEKEKILRKEFVFDNTKVTKYSMQTQLWRVVLNADVKMSHHPLSFAVTSRKQQTIRKQKRSRR